MKRSIHSTLSLLLAGSMTACLSGGESDTQVDQQELRGHIPLDRYSAEIVGVRVVADGQAVAAAKTDGLGNFNIRVPRGRDYSFEIVTTDGSRTVLTGPIDGSSPLTFDVCDPQDGFDLGEIHPFDYEGIDGDDQPWGHSDDDCSVPPWICEEIGPDGQPIDCWDVPLPCNDPAADPSFCFDDPLPCSDPAADPDFCWDDPDPCDSMDPSDCDPPPPCDGNDPGDCEPWPPEPCDSMDPSDCDPPPPPCDGNDPGDCEPWPPEPCDSMDPSDCDPPPPCDGNDPGDCEPWPPEPCDSMDPSDCDPPPPCDGNDPGDCEWPPEPCDGMDPANCDPGIPEPCSDDGFGMDPMCEDPWDGECAGGYDEPACWPEPDICVMTPEGGFEDCDEYAGGAPEFPFPDFGCQAE